jgi:CheY-like chemotaxis protein
VNSHVELTVEDRGPGIPPEFLPHIFERFRQADASSTRPHGGLGLGLAIVRHIVELHGGTVAVANRSAGTGAVFTLRFPRRSVTVPAIRGAGEPAALAEVGGTDGAEALAGLHVLVIDDEEDARDMVATALRMAGAQVSLAGTADEGLDLVQRERPAVILCDIEMPGRDGYALMREIRRLPDSKGGRTPAVALTAYASTDHRLRALRAGFQIHVAKPAQPAELTTVVASLAGRPSDGGA